MGPVLTSMITAAALAVSALIAPAVAQPAFASDSPPLAPGEVIRDRGFVARVTDGDTFRFANTPNRRTESYTVVRLIGVQAPEVSRKGFGAGECKGDVAQQVLVDIAEGRPVVLASVADTRDKNRDRLLRTAYVKNDNGQWVDLADQMLRRGWGQWFPKKVEPAHNREYRQLADAAAAAGLNIWNPTNCGSRYSPGVPLSMLIQPDPSGNDWKNVNGEYVRIANQSTTQAVDMSGWSLRDGSLHWLKFPSGTVVQPNSALTVRVGEGPDTADTLYWGRKRPAFSNLTVTKSFMGDGAYLIDPQGNVRAWFLYPCITSCDDPRTGAITITKVRYDPPGNEIPRPNEEYFRLVNRSGTSFGLIGYEVRIGGYTREFTWRDTLAPGQRMTIRIGKGRDRGNTRYFGMGHSILDNGGDVITLRSFDARIVACKAWGSGSRSACW